MMPQFGLAWDGRRDKLETRDSMTRKISSFRGRPRCLRTEPGIQFFFQRKQNWIPGSIADEAGDRPGMTSKKGAFALQLHRHGIGAGGQAKTRAGRYRLTCGSAADGES